LKTGRRLTAPRGFESLPLRYIATWARTGEGPGVKEFESIPLHGSGQEREVRLPNTRTE
jgi:hypothetical protein